MSFGSTLLAFANAPAPEDAEGAYASGWNILRIGGWVFAIGYLLNLAVMLLIQPLMMQAFSDNASGFDFGVFFLFAALVNVIFTTAFTLAILYWIGWTIEAWARKESAALTSAKIMAIVGIVVYAILVLVTLPLLLTGSFFGPAFSDGGTSTSFGTAWIGLPVTVAKLILSILLIAYVMDEQTKETFA